MSIEAGSSELTIRPKSCITKTTHGSRVLSLEASNSNQLVEHLACYRSDFLYPWHAGASASAKAKAKEKHEYHNSESITCFQIDLNTFIASAT